MGEFRMPSLGADMAAGTLVAWRKQAGDVVHKGDILAEVETDKGVIEVEVFEDGVLAELLVPLNAKVPVGTPLARLTAPGAAAPGAAAPAPAVAPVVSAPAPAPAPVVAPAPSAPAAPAPAAGRVHATPLARTVAQALHVDVASVRGTGDGGVILRADVERAAREAETKKSAPERMRAAIAAAMTRSKREIPHFYLAETLDLGPALAWLAARNESRSVTARVLPGALFVWAAARAAKAVPELNAHWTGEAAPPIPGVHVGVAVSLRGGGLVAPALHDAHTLDVDGVMRGMADLVERARAGRLTAAEMGEATLTVTSLGERGVEMNFPVIVPPQVAIVGFGKVVERPWVVGGAVVPRSVVTATLACDHRVTDGHRAAKFLYTLAAYLQDPEKP